MLHNTRFIATSAAAKSAKGIPPQSKTSVTLNMSQIPVCSLAKHSVQKIRDIQYEVVAEQDCGATGGPSAVGPVVAGFFGAKMDPGSLLRFHFEVVWGIFWGATGEASFRIRVPGVSTFEVSTVVGLKAMICLISPSIERVMFVWSPEAQPADGLPQLRLF